MKRPDPFQLVGPSEPACFDRIGQWPNLPRLKQLDHGLIADVLFRAYEQQAELCVGSETFLYVIREQTGLLKIGVAVDPLKRMSGFQIAHPYPLVMVGYVPATVALERFVHREFRQERVRGEWFAMSPRLHQFLAVLESASHFRWLIESQGDESGAETTVATIVGPVEDAIAFAGRAA